MSTKEGMNVGLGSDDGPEKATHRGTGFRVVGGKQEPRHLHRDAWFSSTGRVSLAKCVASARAGEAGAAPWSRSTFTEGLGSRSEERGPAGRGGSGRNARVTYDVPGRETAASNGRRR